MLNSEHAQQEYSQLQRRAIALTERAPVELQIDQGLLERSQDEASEFLTASATREQFLASSNEARSSPATTQAKKND